MRRFLLIPLVALALAVPPGGALATDIFAPPGAPAADLLVLAPWQDQTTLVAPEDLPAPSASAGIGPGTRIYMDLAEGTALCTANFVWTDGERLLLGTAGHCLLAGISASATHGGGTTANLSKLRVRACVDACTFGGTLSFRVQGVTVALGQVAYARKSDNGNPLGSDFGLVEIPPALHAHVRPGMPVWGGPTSSDQAPLAFGTQMCHYGHGIVLGETYLTQARAGIVNGQGWPGFYYGQYTSQGGDSGSATVACDRDGTTLRGAAPIGIHTHSGYGGAQKFGTTVDRAVELALRDAGLAIRVVPEA